MNMKKVSAKQAIAQILKMNATASEIEFSMENIIGSNWISRKQRNDVKAKRIAEINAKIDEYRKYISEDEYNNSDLPCTLCMSYKDFID